jgi:hypothetical protein
MLFSIDRLTYKRLLITTGFLPRSRVVGQALGLTVLSGHTLGYTRSETISSRLGSFCWLTEVSQTWHDLTEHGKLLLTVK